MEPSQALPTIKVESLVPQDTRPLEGEQILLVEDCPDQRRLYIQFLTMAGAIVALSTNGKSTIEMVKESPTLYRAIVMDYLMRKVDGVNVTSELRSAGYEGVILGITAYGTDKVKQSWLQAGCNSVLEKPLDRTELIDAVFREIRSMV